MFHQNEDIFNLQMEHFLDVLDIMNENDKMGLAWKQLGRLSPVLLSMTNNQELDMKLLNLFSEFLDIRMELYRENFSVIKTKVIEGYNFNSELYLLARELAEYDGYGFDTKKHLKLLSLISILPVFCIVVMLDKSNFKSILEISILSDDVDKVVSS